ncbi:MAG TPA: glycoside hydrolase family 2 TIM barrel-domain containing protein [Verrucomicrobiota bacterium]|nr:glycoside hydrolase family 2 TIM barrel-domain containing protein [Verrucomicrobiota bacterium]HNU50290.1 glycoside hydrolase family 2 TIM barrel-domain containing protein [Verrucomicrobiota bacterium]
MLGLAAVVVMVLLGALPARGTTVLSLDGEWLLATDPGNVGRDGRWWTAPRPEAKPTKVPWIIQDAFPGYHGVAWYWKEFEGPEAAIPGGRTLLRFWQVDYKADVWLNDTPVGAHEGGESPFVFDVTALLRPRAKNRLAVRVLNPTHEPVDGIVLNETPHRNKALPYTAGSAWNQGGIWDSVEVLTVPAVYIEDLFVRPDWKTGVIRVQLNVRNAGAEACQGTLQLTVAPAAAGETLTTRVLSPELKPGDTGVDTTLTVPHPRLWELEDPFLYRVTARVGAGSPQEATALGGVHEYSVRCGFRDFRLERGAFRLNGKRIYLRCSHTGNCCPIGLELPHDPDYLRRDLINQKMMRYNAIRFISGVPKRYQLDLADEIGLMVYPEAYAGWCLADSPKMKERYNESVFGMIRRDRNHPCITMWGLLNETPDGAVFRHAVSVLPEIRRLDDTRVVLLNSGRFDHAGSVAGIEVWRTFERTDPCVTRNSTDHVVKALGITWQPGQIAFHPGRDGEYAVVRWTAPSAERVEVSAVYRSIAEAATTDLHLLHNGKPLFDAAVNLAGRGPEAAFSATLEVKAGDTLDSVCGWGNRNYGADTTALAMTVKSASGKTWDAERDFSIDRNPNGVWSYGFFKPGDTPVAAGFALFPNGLAERAIGSISNPGSRVWEDILSDQHPYQRVPHTAEVIRTLRTLGGNGKPVWLSEYGIGSAVDLLRVCRWYEQAGKTEVEDARFYQRWRDQYLADWQRYRLDDVFDRPEDFFAQSIARMGGQRLLGINAIRANPNVIGHSLTGTLDQGMTAEGVWTTFRELKPGAADALFDAWAPLRWCLFVEPANVYRRTPVTLEAVLANEDVLAPGEYPVRLQVVGPNLARVFEKRITVTIADPKGTPEPSMVQPVFSEEIHIEGPPGSYRFLATFERGAAACGEEVKFFVDVAPEEMPRVETEVVLLSADAGLARWLTEGGIRHRAYAAGPAEAREVILVSGRPAQDPAVVFPDLARRIARGSAVVFLTTDTYAKGDQPTGWLPLKSRGGISGIARWLYHADEWAKRHPIFEGLPCGGLMDYSHYRELIPDVVFSGLDPVADPVAGGINASWGYQSGLLVAVCKFGAGEFILNALSIRDSLGKVPQADRLLRNMLRFAARDTAQPPVDLPADFDTQLRDLGLHEPTNPTRD